MRFLPTLALLPALVGADALPPLRVRATAVVAPCVKAAVRAFPAPAGGVAVEVAGARTPGPADLIVASAVELTRALEGGAAEPNTDVDVALVPWVVQVRSGGPAIKSAQDLAGSGIEVVVPDSPAAYEAFRWARSTTGGRARSANARELREAVVVLLPLSMAGPGDRIGVDVPSLRARAALGVEPARRADAEALLAFLRSEAGQAAFAACRTTP